MNDSMQTLKDDIAFMKAVTEDSSRALIRDGAVLIAVGAIFGLDSFRFWGIEAGFLPWAKPTEHLYGFDALAIFLVVIHLIMRRFRGVAQGAPSRAVSGAWSSMGVAIGVALVSLGAAAWRLKQPLLMVWIPPLILFTLYGASWWIAFAVKRRAWFAGVAIGSFATAVLSGLSIPSPHEWAVLAFGLFLWVAAPGIVIVHQARASS
jgi:hypothetical protein